MSPTSYSLNLSPRYAPNWTAWEVAREIICNAIDASPEDFRVTPHGDNQLKVWTPTVPDLCELFVIGQGSKSPGGSTIGQFGEGLKMAALVATRTEGGRFRVKLPGQDVRFMFDESMGAQVLHAEVLAGKAPAGCEVIIDMPGIGKSYQHRILEDRADGPRPKARPDELRVYCKGVHVKSESNLSSIWDWNLNGLTINRDRSMVERFTLVYAIAQWLQDHATDEHLEEMIRRPDTIEGHNAIDCIYNSRWLTRLGEAFNRVHGDNAVLEDARDMVNDAAKSRGLKPVELSKEMAAKLAGIVKSAREALPKDADLVPVDPSRHAQAVARLRTLDPIIAAPHFGVRIFANHDETLKGLAVIEDCVIWLNEGLFTPGNDLELVRCYLHEAGHIMASAGDETFGFEHTLDGIAGRLAIALLPGLLGEFDSQKEPA